MSKRPEPAQTLVAVEKRVLGAMLVDPDRCGVALDTLREDDFQLGGHQEVFRAIRDLVERGEQPTVLSVPPLVRERNPGAKGVDGSIAALVADVSSAAFIERNCRTLAESRAIRDLRGELDELRGRLAHAEPGGDALGEVLDELSEMSLAIRDPRKSQTVSTIGEAIQGAFQEMRAAQELQDRPGLQSGLPELDELIGGLRNGETTVLAAPTSLGKSVLALQIAARAATRTWEHLEDRAAHTLYVVTEMRQADLCKRLLSLRAEVDFLRIRDGRTDPTETERIGEALADLRGVPLSIDACGRGKVSRIARQARAERRAGRLDFLVIDLAPHLRPSERERYKNREQEVAAVSHALTDLSLELDIPVLMTCQVNREGAKRQSKKPNHETDLRESAALGHDASIVLMPWRLDDWETSRVDVEVSKNRNGLRGGCTLRQDFAHMRFRTNVAQPNLWEQRKDLA